MMVTDKTLPIFSKYGHRVKIEVASSKELANILQDDIPHQGVILRVDKLPEQSLKNWTADNKVRSVVLILDQITDTRNVGGILRSAAAFNVDFVIIPTNNSVPETAGLAKAASGALEMVPMVRVPNITKAINYMKDLGYWVYGFDCDGRSDLRKCKFDAKSLLIMGSESEGMRRLVKESCDFLVRIDISQVQSLNVSVATGIVLYHSSLALE